MMAEKDFKPRIFYGLSLEKMVPEDHLVRVLSKVLDLTFVRDMCGKYYSHTGKPSVDPVVLFKMMLLGYFYGIDSERKLAESCSLNLAFRWYLKYDFDEPTPNHSVLSKARARFGKEVFEQFFQRILDICVEKGLVSEGKLFVDATLVEADAALSSLVPRDNVIRLKEAPSEYVEKFFRDNAVEGGSDDEEDGDKGPGSGTGKKKGTSSDSMKWSFKNRGKRRTNKECRSSTDPDASYIARGGRGAFFCYKCSYAVNEQNRVITAVEVTPGAVADEYMLEELLDKQPLRVDEVCADSIYGTIENYRLCAERGIRPSITPRYSKRKKGKIPKEEYKYSPSRDVYICPEGKELTKSYYDKRRDRWQYATRTEDCRGCPLKSRCCPNSNIMVLARRVGQKYADWANLWLKTPRAKRTIKQRPLFSECAFAEAKTLHGLSRAKYRRLKNVTIQGLMTAAVQNIKRLISIHNRKERITSEKSSIKYLKSPLKLLSHLFLTIRLSFSV